jgi:hypothetical protein
MKKLLLTFSLVILGISLSEAKPVTYYWVVESTTCIEPLSIIKIYNDQHELVYTEKIEGKVLDPTDKRVIERLNRKVRKLKALKERI